MSQFVNSTYLTLDGVIEEPQTWPAMAGNPLADRMNATPKYVASRTLTEDLFFGKRR